MSRCTAPEPLPDHVLVPLKWYGYTEGFVRELWRRAPRLELDGRVYLEDGRGRRIGVWDPVVEDFVGVEPGLDVFLGG